MAKGRLSIEEKGCIQSGIANNDKVTNIAMKLGRTEKVVQNYIDGELTRLWNAIAKIQTKAEQKPMVPRANSKKNKPEISESKNTAPISSVKTKNEAKAMLVGVNIDKDDADEMIENIMKKAKRPISSPQELFNYAMKHRNAKHMMVRKTIARKKKGITAMTEAASQRLDEVSKTYRQRRGSSGAVWDTKGNKKS